MLWHPINKGLQSLLSLINTCEWQLIYVWSFLCKIDKALTHVSTSQQSYGTFKALLKARTNKQTTKPIRTHKCLKGAMCGIFTRINHCQHEFATSASFVFKKNNDRLFSVFHNYQVRLAGRCVWLTGSEICIWRWWRLGSNLDPNTTTAINKEELHVVHLGYCLIWLH